MKKLLIFPLILLLLALPAYAWANGAPRDGQYTVEVTLSGGSGRASISSPAQVTVADGAMTARIIWSSPNYDCMLINGAKYLPVNASGNSEFEVPLSALNKEIAVSAETTAMSEPHIIDYALYFDSTTLKAAVKNQAAVISIITATAVLAAGVFAVILVRRKCKRETGHES